MIIVDDYDKQIEADLLPYLRVGNYLPSKQHHWAIKIVDDRNFILYIHNGGDISSELLKEILIEGYILIKVGNEEEYINDEWSGIPFHFTKKPFGLY